MQKDNLKSTDDIIDEISKEFAERQRLYGKEIQDKVNEASRMIKEAEELSEKYELPFDLDAYYGTFVPNSVADKLEEIDRILDEGDESYESYMLTEIVGGAVGVYKLFDHDYGEFIRGWWVPSRFC